MFGNNNPDLKVMVDSGGYQLQTGQVRREEWTNRKALDYSVKNGDIFPVLDSPLVPYADFKKNRRETFESALYYRDHRPGRGEVILNVAQGRDLGELERWLELMAKVELDGWALGSSSRNGKHPSTKKLVEGGIFYVAVGGLGQSERIPYLRYEQPQEGFVSDRDLGAGKTSPT
jgi:hypothetical protein